MECLDADTVIAWLDGTLAGPRAHEVEAHIDQCASCRRLISEAAGDAPTPAAGEAVVAAAVAAGVARPAVGPVSGRAIRGPALEQPRVGPAIRPSAPATARTRRRRWLGPIAALAIGAASGAAVVWWLRPAPGSITAPAATAARLLDRPAQVYAARAGAGGAVYVSAAFRGEGLAGVRLVRRGKDGALVEIPQGSGAVIAAVRGERLLVLREAAEVAPGVLRGRLARIDTAGRAQPVPGDPGDVIAADFLTDEGAVAVARLRGGALTIEAPIGTVRHRGTGAVRALRASRDGRVAFIEVAAPPGAEPDARVRVLDVTAPGGPTTLEGGWRDPEAVAWAGGELLVGGTREDRAGGGVWRAVPGSGAAPRLAWSSARRIALHDAADGAVLASEVERGRRLFVRRPDSSADRDVTATPEPVLAGLSLDGAWLSFVERAADRAPAVYLARTSTGEPVLLGRGLGGALDRAGGQVLVRSATAPGRLAVITAGSSWDGGGPVERALAPGGAGAHDGVAALGWLDDRRVAFVSGARGALALHVQAVDGEPMRRGSWPGGPPATSFRVAPGGATIGAVDELGRPALIDAASLAVAPVAAGRDEQIVGWSFAADAVWLARRDRWPVEVSRYRLMDGAVAKLLEIAAPRPGAQPPDELHVAGDGATYAYSCAVIETELVRVDGALGGAP